QILASSPTVKVVCARIGGRDPAAGLAGVDDCVDVPVDGGVGGGGLPGEADAGAHHLDGRAAGEDLVDELAVAVLEVLHIGLYGVVGAEVHEDDVGVGGGECGECEGCHVA